MKIIMTASCWAAHKFVTVEINKTEQPSCCS